MGDYRRAAHGYEPARDEAMQAFKRSWRGEWASQVQPPQFSPFSRWN
jgi:hypothetical protein